MLMESWKPSADLKTWTLTVRDGVMWHNGEELNAEHVAWNIRRWSDPALGSSNFGLSTFAALTEPTGEKDSKGRPLRRPIKNGVEVLDSRTLRLNLGQPVLSVAEDCGEFCTLVVHPSFKAPLSRNPIGTGPYTLAELRVGDRCILKRVLKTTDGKDFRYWGGEVYLDEIHFYHYEQDNPGGGAGIRQRRCHLRTLGRADRIGAIDSRRENPLRRNRADPVLPHAGGRQALQ
jgi:peptide/nickel transport system substrate-binding protein